MGKVSEEDFKELKEKFLELEKRIESLEKAFVFSKQEEHELQHAETGSETQTEFSQENTALQQNKKLQEEVNDLRGKNTQLLQKNEELQKLNAVFEQEQKQLQKRIGILQNENAELKKKLAEKTELPQQKELTALYNALQQIDGTVKNLLTPYYDLDNFIIFLMQCGQFSLLNQFWGSCRDYVLTQHDVPKNLKDFLFFLLSLYNQANKGNEAKELLAEAGSKYDFEKQQRMGENGTAVQEMLLPGLASPSGKINHKVLVTLQ